MPQRVQRWPSLSRTRFLMVAAEGEGLMMTPREETNGLHAARPHGYSAGPPESCWYASLGRSLSADRPRPREGQAQNVACAGRHFGADRHASFRSSGLSPGFLRSWTPQGYCTTKLLPVENFFGNFSGFL